MMFGAGGGAQWQALPAGKSEGGPEVMRKFQHCERLACGLLQKQSLRQGNHSQRIPVQRRVAIIAHRWSVVRATGMADPI